MKKKDKPITTGKLRGSSMVITEKKDGSLKGVVKSKFNYK